MQMSGRKRCKLRPHNSISVTKYIELSHGFLSSIIMCIYMHVFDTFLYPLLFFLRLISLSPFVARGKSFINRIDSMLNRHWYF